MTLPRTKVVVWQFGEILFMRKPTMPTCSVSTLVPEACCGTFNMPTRPNTMAPRVHPWS